MADDGMSNLGRLHRAQFHHACKLFYEIGPTDTTAYVQANSICRRLLMDPYLGDLYTAGAHYILAFSDDNFLYHAKEAVKGYEGIYAHIQPTRKQWLSNQVLIATAKQALAGAEAYERYLAGEAMEEHEKIFKEVPQQTQSETTDDRNPEGGMDREHSPLTEELLDHRADLEHLLNTWDDDMDEVEDDQEEAIAEEEEQPDGS